MSDVSLIRRRKVVRFTCHDVQSKSGMAAILFSRFGEKEINIIHMYNTEHNEKSGDIIVTIGENQSEEAFHVLEKVKGDIGASHISAVHNLAILTFEIEDSQFDSALDSVLVAFKALTSSRIEVNHISASDKRVFVVLPDNKAIRASNALERALKEGPIILHI